MFATRSPIPGASLRQRPKVLIADDDPAIRKVLTRILELNDYAVIACSDGSQAIEAFSERLPQAVILDVRMPGIDGLMVCSHIRGESDVPIIMLTALDDESDAAAALEAGADDYIRKPFGARVVEKDRRLFRVESDYL